MANVRLQWGVPTPSPQQDQIRGYKVETRVVGAPVDYTFLQEVAHPDAEILLQDIAPGDWEYQVITVDVGGLESQPAHVAVSVPFDEPSPVSNLTATVE